MALGSFIEYYRDNTRNELTRTIMELFNERKTFNSPSSIQPSPSVVNAPNETTTLTEQFATTASSSATPELESAKLLDSSGLNEGTVDFILSLFIKIFKAINHLEPQVAMGAVVGIGFISLLLGLASEDIVNFHTIILTICIGGFIYWYMKSQYSNELQRLRKKNIVLKMDSALDQLCLEGDIPPENKELCDNYVAAKSNFYQINNSLIQKYNWKKD